MLRDELERTKNVETPTGIVSDHQEIHRFLLDVLGYGKLAQIIALGETSKPEGEAVQGIMDGTIFGTGYYRWPTISGIKNAKDARKSSERFSGKVTKSSIIKPELPFHVLSSTVFYGDGNAEVQKHVTEQIQPNLPSGKLTTEAITTQLVEHTIVAPDYSMYLRSGYRGSGVILGLSFDLEHTAVDEINQLVRQYSALQRRPRN